MQNTDTNENKKIIVLQEKIKIILILHGKNKITYKFKEDKCTCVYTQTR